MQGINDLCIPFLVTFLNDRYPGLRFDEVLIGRSNRGTELERGGLDVPRRDRSGHVLLHLAAVGRDSGPLHDGPTGHSAHGEEAGGLGASHGRRLV